MSELVELWQFREVLWNLVRRNLKVRYKNSFLGFFWSLLNPLMQIGVWWFVFGILWNRSEDNYMAFLITGFLPWLFFSQTILDGTASVTQDIALVKKAYFPRTMLPLSALLSNLIHLLLAFTVLLALFALWRVDVNVNYWLVIPATLLIALFAYGLSSMTAAWSVFYADVKFIVGTLMGLWFFLTPVLYPIHLVLMKKGELNSTNWLRVLIHDYLPYFKVAYLMDPVAIGILGYRSALLNEGKNPIIVYPGQEFTQAEALSRQAAAQAVFPFDQYVIAAAIIAVGTAILGHLIFRRLAPSFAEKG